MDERPRRGGHDGEIGLPLKDLGRLRQPVGGEVLLDELEELLLREADLGLGDDGRPVKRLQRKVTLRGAAQAAGTV